jgi:hypothetical protein
MIHVHGFAIDITIASKNLKTHPPMEADRARVHRRCQGMNLGTTEIPRYTEKMFIKHSPIALSSTLGSNADKMNVRNTGICL